MTILESIGAASTLIKGATSLVRELKRPSLDQEAFAALLRQQLTEHASPEAAHAKLVAASDEFVRLRDADADGLLSRDESGLDKRLFAKLDHDGDGKLSAEELRRAYRSPAAPLE